MPEEKQAEIPVAADNVDPNRSGTPLSEPPTAGSGEISPAIPPIQVRPTVYLLFIIAVVFFLAAIGLHQCNGTGAGIPTDDPEVAKLKADLDAQREELNRQRMELGLPPLEGGSESIAQIAERLKQDADALADRAARFQAMLREKDAEISRGNGELLSLGKRLKTLSQENSRLQGEMNNAFLSVSEMERLRDSAADLQAQRDRLSRELADVRAQLSEASGTVGAEEYQDLQRRYDEALRSKAFFESRANELEFQIKRKNELFAKSENQLLPAAVDLCRRLRKLEGRPDRAAEYSRIRTDLGAEVLREISFETGSSELSPTDMEKLTAIAEGDVADGDLVLIIGYASKTGDALANERLSSERATAAAEYFDSRKRPGQLVQAVYLGQTDRFSTTVHESNQICEVWRIRGK